ncbi:hypothetical protein [uncultured Sphingomonas sp.]|uniref:hypothetical protein n=1 Tax=uncultured Sphingomonas sp. TaxID=158754 RepID=UPI0035CB3E35
MIFHRLNEQEQKNATIALTLMPLPVSLLARDIATPHGSGFATAFVVAMLIAVTGIGAQIYLSAKEDAASNSGAWQDDDNG